MVSGSKNSKNHVRLDAFVIGRWRIMCYLLNTPKQIEKAIETAKVKIATNTGWKLDVINFTDLSKGK